MTLRTLGNEPINRWGQTWQIIKRKGLAAIVEQTISETTVRYVAIWIRVRPPFIRDGVEVTPAREAFPSKEEWGNYAWTFFTLAEAETQFSTIKELIRKKELRDQK